MKKSLLTSLPFILLTLSSTTNADTVVPNIFSPDTPALAGEVNENFDVLSQDINKNTSGIIILAEAVAGLSYKTETYTDFSNGNTTGPYTSELLSVTCPSNSILTGGGLMCNSSGFNSATTNFGVISSSVPAGNSYLGFCAVDGGLLNVSKNGPAVSVYALCLSLDLGSGSSSKSNITPKGKAKDNEGNMSKEAKAAFDKLKFEAKERAAMFINMK